MKKKRGIFIFATTLLILVIAGLFIVSGWRQTNHGKLDTRFAFILGYNKYLNRYSLKNMPVNKIREITNKNLTKWGSKPIPFGNIKNIKINTTTSDIPVRIYTPSSGAVFPIIIYSHGGGWVGGSIDDYDNICRKLSKNTNAIVISVGYRLAPENPYPAGLCDVYNVFQWSYKNAKIIKGDEKKIAIVGDSAGGNYSAVVSQMVRDKNGPHIACQVLIYPSTNIYELNSRSWSYFENDFNLSKENMEKYISLYVPRKEDRKDSYASPLLAKNLTKLPPALIITAEFDPLRDEGEAYGEKLKAAGVDVMITRYKGVMHGFINMDMISNKANEALKQVSLYLQEEFRKAI